MAYVNKKRPYKKEYQQQKDREEHPNRMERQKLRRKVDKNGKDANSNGVADKREGKDLAHKKPLSKGGSNKDGYTVQSKSKNRSFKRNSDSSIKNKQYLANK
jgi:hypothetical protein|tara:strand:- start:1035 stop:1340 length:306 start_codon:yes stop_codon:yes gene_type:complete